MHERARIVLLVFLLSSAGAGHVASAQPLTRGAALERALAQNPQIAAARAREAAAAARGAQVDAADHPLLTLQVGVGPGLQAELVPGSAVQSTQDAYGDVSMSDLSVFVGSQAQLLQPLYTFGKIGMRQEATTHEVNAREAQTRMTRAQVALEVAQYYEGLWYAREAVLFFEEVEHQLERAIASTQERLEDDEPDVSERDMLQLRTAKSYAQLQLHRARASAAQAEGALRAYLGISPGEALELPDGELQLVGARPGALRELVQRARQHRPELDALSEGSAALRALAEAEEAGRLPDLFALAFVSAAYTPGRDLVDTRYAVDPLQHFVPGALLGVRWSWQAGQASARASERRAEADELSDMRRWALRGIPAEVRAALESAQRGLRDHVEASRGVELAKKWVVMAVADNTIGLADSRAVVESIERYALLRTAALEAAYRYNVAMAELAKATGTLDLPANPLYPGEPL